MNSTRTNTEALAVAAVACALLLATPGCGGCDGNAGTDSGTGTDSSSDAGPVEISVSLTPTPAGGSQFGDYPVTVTADSPVFAGLDGSDIRVRVGEVDLIFLRVLDDFTVEGDSQGHPSPSDDNLDPFAVDVRIDIPGAFAVENGAFTFDPPLDPLFNDVWAIGASFTAGTQSNSINAPGQLMSPVAQICRVVGAYFPQPLAVAPGLPPTFGLADVDPITGEGADPGAAALTAILPLLQETGGTFANVRADPYVMPHNTALPGGVVRHIVWGSNGDGLHILDLFIQAPFEHFLSQLVLPSPMENLEMHSPTLVIGSIDFYGNDVLGGDDTPTEEIAADLMTLFNLIADLPGAPPFVVETIVDVNAVPVDNFEQDERYEVLRANHALYTAAESVNADLMASGLPPRIFIGDFFSDAAQVVEEPLGSTVVVGGTDAVIWGCDTAVDPTGTCSSVLQTVNGEPNVLVTLPDGTPTVYGMDRTEGFFSHDGLHLTNTGYAMLANLAIDLINVELGPTAAIAENRLLVASVPLVDLPAVSAVDPMAPHNLVLEAEMLRMMGVVDHPPFTAWADPAPLPRLELWDRCALRRGVYGIAESDWAASGCPLATGVMLTTSAPNVAAGAPGGSIDVTLSVSDDAGAPIPGFAVVFWVDYDGDEEGRIGFEDGILTDLAGIASTTYTAGSVSGPVTIHAQVAGVVVTTTVMRD